MGLSYAGAVTPQEAHALREAGEATLVDVRTQPEWQFVGHVPDAPLIEWPRGGGPAQLEAFVREIQGRFKPDEKLLLLCRSGVRSHSAAELLARAGYKHAYNVLEGFEGEQGLGANGWRTAGLPWKKG
jgi:rhodanese-related sulfurtransferase